MDGFLDRGSHNPHLADCSDRYAGIYLFPPAGYGRLGKRHHYSCHVAAGAQLLSIKLKKAIGIKEENAMRVERNEPQYVYNDFWDWILTGWHPLWIIALAFGCLLYLITTVEV